jgi:hypothetical protein
VFVPPQAEQRKPFLVRRDIQGVHVREHSITIPWRDGQQTRFDDIEHVHAALRAARQQSIAEEAIVERVHLEALPPSFRSVFIAARVAGLETRLYSGGVRVHLPGEPPLDVTAADLHPNLEELALHTTMERLVEHGVPVRRTPRGRLMPDVDDP